MLYALDRFADQIRDALLASGLVPTEHIELAEPKATIRADLAMPCFRAAKAAGVPPQQLAEQLAAAITFPDDSLVGSVGAAGPFLNFAVHPERFARLVLADVEAGADRYGSDDRGGGRTVVVEYSSPNVAKRMHVGHIRSTIIGQALNNLLAFAGCTTLADNHLGDYGKQFGTMIAAIERYGRPGGEGEQILTGLEQIYADYNRLKGIDSSEEAWVDPDKLDDEARLWSLRLEQNDGHARELWQWMIEATLEANARNYERLGVHFDTQHGESFYAGELPTVLAKVAELDIAERDAGGALAVKGIRDRHGKELPSFLVQRSDGATLYLTRDLATIIYREAEYRPSKIIYVVEQRQELHFRQTFALVRELGYAHDIDLVHITFGTIFGANGQPLSTRKGNMVYLEALLDDARDRARAVIVSKIADGKAELTAEQVDEVAELVGVGAVVYNDLFQDPKRNLTLDWERMLSFEGNSAPYIQYTHARCCSILREAGELPAFDAAVLAEEQEQAVIKQLARFPEAVRRAGDNYAPYVVADWVYNLAREYSRFYRDLSVLKAATPELRAARLHLTAATACGIRNALALLLIGAPERM